MPKEEPIPHQNPIDLTLGLRRPAPIADSASVSDPRFKTITFDPYINDKPRFVSQLASAAEAFEIIAENLLKKGDEEHGSWVWTPILLITPEYRTEILNNAQKNRINVIYLSIDSYLDIFSMKDSKAKTELESKFKSIIRDFIIEANNRGIAVDAEAGWKNWAEVGHTYKPIAILDFVKHFNEISDYKFRGFQYDVEPYLLERYKSDPVDVLMRFVELIDNSERFLGSTKIKFSVVVPDYFDKKDKATPEFNYNGKMDSVFGHIYEVLDRRRNSSIIVMSYRNFAEGRDGSIQVSKNEIRTANKLTNRTDVIIAQETGDFPPPYITFFGTSKERLQNETSKIRRAFQRQHNFGGFAIHYINTYLALK